MPGFRLSTYRCGHDAPPATTLRIGTVRFLPRGVPKEDYAARGYFDVWLPLLSPSRELVAGFKDGSLTMQALFRGYRREMKETDARQTIALVAALAARWPIAIGCYCEDESRCHRSVLAELIRKAAGVGGD